MKKNYSISMKKNLKKLYIMNLFWNAQFHIVVFTLFILSKGFTLQQFFLIESTFALFALLAEIPTGSFGDTISKKWSLVIGYVMHIVTTLAIILSNSFTEIIIASAFSGIGIAFVSGSDHALIFDSLKELKKEKEFKKYLGSLAYVGSWSMAIAGIIGGLIAQIDLSYAWWAWFVIGFPVLFISLTITEPKTRGDKISNSYFNHIKHSFNYIISNNVGYFILYSVLIWSFFSVGFWLWQPYMKAVGISVAYFGFVYAILNIVSGYISKKSDYIEHNIGMLNSLIIIPSMLMIAFIFQSFQIMIFGLLFLLLHTIASGYSLIINEDYINSRIPSTKRATILSIKNMFHSLIFVLLSPLIGYFIDLYSLSMAYLIMAGGIFVVGVVLILIKIIYRVK